MAKKSNLDGLFSQRSRGLDGRVGASVPSSHLPSFLQDKVEKGLPTAHLNPSNLPSGSSETTPNDSGTSGGSDDK